VPANLFSDLCLPEIEVRAPVDYDGAANVEEPVLLALAEFAPGNVTLRYAVVKTRGLWIDPGNRSSTGELDVSDCLLQDAEIIASVEVEGRAIDVMRPYVVAPVVVTKDVSPTSSGRLSWDVRIEPESGSYEATIPDHSEWQAHIDKIKFFLKAGTGGVRVLRYSFQGEAEVGYKRNEKQRIRYRLANHGDLVALGVELDVDGLLLRVRPPADVELFHLENDEVRLRQLRRDRFLYEVNTKSEAELNINPFLAGWLGELALAALVFDLKWNAAQEATEIDWTPEDWKFHLLEAFDRSFQGLRSGEEDETSSPLRTGIEETLSDPAVVEVLSNALEDARNPTDAWYWWLRQRFNTTVGAAVHTAVQTVLPEFSAEDDLMVDIIDSEGSEYAEVWLTETTIGGGGLLESLFASYSEDPRRFWNLVSGALEPSDTEIASLGLIRFVDELAGGVLETAAFNFRNATDDEDALALWQGLLDDAARCGIPPTHTLSVSMATRLFLEGSSEGTDQLVATALDEWSKIEATFGFSIDQRTACGLLSRNSDFVSRLAIAVSDDIKGEDGWAYGVLLSVLWARPESVRAQALQAPMRYSRYVFSTERTLVLDGLEHGGDRISIHTETWRTEADLRLAFNGSCVLSASVEGDGLLKAAILEMMVTPVEVGALLCHPRLISIRRKLDTIEAFLELEEAPQ